MAPRLIPIARTLLTALVGSWVALGAPPARAAQQPTAKLVYTRGKGAEGCPSKVDFIHAVESEMGRSPFVDEAPTTVVIDLGREDSVFVGRVKRLDQRGANVWPREPFTQQSCKKLVDDIALAVSIVLSAPIQPEAPASVLPIELRGAIGATMLSGLLPRPSALFFGSVGVRRTVVSVMIEGYGALPVTYVSPIGDVSALVAGGALVPCLHWRVLMGCAVVIAGAMRASGVPGIAGGKVALGAYVGVGARVGSEIPLVRHLSMRVSVDVLGAAVRPAIHVEALQGASDYCREAGVSATCSWRASPVFMSAGAAIVGYFGGPDERPKGR